MTRMLFFSEWKHQSVPRTSCHWWTVRSSIRVISTTTMTSTSIWAQARDNTSCLQSRGVLKVSLKLCALCIDWNFCSLIAVQSGTVGFSLLQRKWATLSINQVGISWRSGKKEEKANVIENLVGNRREAVQVWRIWSRACCLQRCSGGGFLAKENVGIFLSTFLYY